MKMKSNDAEAQSNDTAEYVVQNALYSVYACIAL